MKTRIGMNIRRLRAEKGATQEQLAEVMNVTCAAVSKWERNETYPDITLLQPLAFYFGVSIDELMGYDKEKVEEDIREIIENYAEYRKNDPDKAKKLIEDAFRAYPNDYRIMYDYMWSRGIQEAEPDPEAALAHRDELSKICDTILGGCTDGKLRLGAWKMKAILLHAEGKTEEALKIHREKCGSWWNSFEQMNEQLFRKDRPEFLYWAKRNMYELADFAADKLVKSYFFDPSIPCGRMVERVEALGDALYRLGCELEEAYLITQAKTVFGRLRNDMISREYRGAGDGDILRIVDKYLAAAAKLSDLAETDAPLFDALGKSHTDGNLLSYTIESMLSWKNPHHVKLLENEAYKAVIEKYRKQRV